jgi:preprotein translocase subunit SecA
MSDLVTHFKYSESTDFSENDEVYLEFAKRASERDDITEYYEDLSDDELVNKMDDFERSIEEGDEFTIWFHLFY